MPRAKKTTASFVHEDAQSYQHPTADLAARPEIGTQAHFKKAKAPATYHYDSSLAPGLNWDGQIAVKVIDPRGNELLVVKRLEGER